MDQQTSIILQPYDGTWSMGEDYVLQISIDQTIVNLMERIEKLKGISAHRQQIRLSNNKLIPKAREIWALRRHGIQNNTKIKVEPTRPGGWLWNDIEYYIEKLLGEVIDILAVRTSPILLNELEKQIFYPPCFHYTFRVFLKQHPDRILLRTDLGSGNIWVQLTNGIQLPKYESYPLNLGYIVRYDPDEFDWDAYSDVDSIQPLESQITLPDVCYDIAVNSGKHFGCYGTILDTNPFIVVKKDGKYLGHSPVKVATRSPRWNSIRFSVGFQFGSYLGDHTLSFEVWNMKIFEINSPNQRVVFQKIQSVDIVRSELTSFLQPEEANVFRDYYLENKVTEVLEKIQQEEREKEEREKEKEKEGKGGEEKEGKREEREGNGEEVNQPSQMTGNGAVNGNENETNAPPPLSSAPAPAPPPSHEPIEDEILDPFLKKKLMNESEKQPDAQQSLALVIPSNTTAPSTSTDHLNLLQCLSSTSSHGLLTVMGSKTMYQLRILGAYELYSHETQLSEEIQPIVIILWNGIDIGQTSCQRHTRWASWSDAIFNIPVPGNMEPGQCTLEFQIWNLEEIGGGKKFMSKVMISGRQLRELLTKKSPYAMHETLELQLPHIDDKDGGDTHHNHGGVHKKKEKNKNKTIITGGYLSIITGLVGLHENNIRYYEIQLLLGVGMARTEVKCHLFWNSIEIGHTESTTIITEKINKTTTQTKWIWKQNKFILKLTEKDVIKQSELKIDCYDPSTKGVNSYIGCAILSQEELIQFLDQNYLIQMTVTLKKDPKKEEKRVTKGTLTIRGGRYGGRLETERLFEIKGLEFLELEGNLQNSPLKMQHSQQQQGQGQSSPQGNDSNQLNDIIELERGLPHCYCVVYWNEDYLGSTNPVLNDGYPVWELFDQRWFYLSDPQSSPLYYANGCLLIEIWEGNGQGQVPGPGSGPVSSPSPGEGQSTEIYIGSIQLTGNQLEDFMESNTPVTMKLQVTNYRKIPASKQPKTKKFLASKPPPPPPVEPIPVYILLATYGRVDQTPLIELERQETLYNSLLTDEIKFRGGVEEIFEK